MGLSDCRLRWPRECRACAAPSHRSFGPVRALKRVGARATSTVVPAMLSVASARSKERVRTEPKSSAIIGATGEKCGLVVEHTCNDVSARPQGALKARTRCAASPRRHIGHTSRGDNKAGGPRILRALWARPSGGRRCAPRRVAPARRTPVRLRDRALRGTHRRPLTRHYKCVRPLDLSCPEPRPAPRDGPPRPIHPVRHRAWPARWCRCAGGLPGVDPQKPLPVSISPSRAIPPRR